MPNASDDVDRQRSLGTQGIGRAGLVPFDLLNQDWQRHSRAALLRKGQQKDGPAGHRNRSIQVETGIRASAQGENR